MHVKYLPHWLVYLSDFTMFNILKIVLIFNHMQTQQTLDKQNKNNSQTTKKKASAEWNCSLAGHAVPGRNKQYIAPLPPAEGASAWLSSSLVLNISYDGNTKWLHVCICSRNQLMWKKPCTKYEIRLARIKPFVAHSEPLFLWIIRRATNSIAEQESLRIKGHLEEILHWSRNMPTKAPC